MRSLTISILSDLHLDMHFKSHRETTGRIKAFFDPIFMPGGSKPTDVLVIAGDLGHYNSQNLWIIEYLKEHYFKHIVCVLGNHDYYLIHRLQRLDYNMDSFERVQEMRDQLNAIDGIHCLNGNVVEIEGIRFGGCDSWYDGQYLLKNLNSKGVYTIGRPRELWNYTMNDAAYIHGIKRFDEIWEIELPKIEATYRECDIMITHVSPSIVPEHIPEKFYREDDSTCFFTFDGEEYVKNTSAKIWIYGHTHTPNDFEWHGVRLICNQLGYPGENMNLCEKRIELEVENFDRKPDVSQKTIGEALKAASISPKEAFDTLDHAIVLNKFEKIAEGDGDLLVSEYIHTPKALLEYTEDMIASGDVQNLSEALRLMQNEILKLRKENDFLEHRNKQYLEKWDTWEERARALYRQLHGKEAPPQG